MTRDATPVDLDRARGALEEARISPDLVLRSIRLRNGVVECDMNKIGFDLAWRTSQVARLGAPCCQTCFNAQRGDTCLAGAYLVPDCYRGDSTHV